MKVALVHDYIKEYGGAERVLESLHAIFPDAPVYTSVYLPQFLGPHRKDFSSWDIRTSWANHLPFRQKLISPLRLLSPWLFRSLDFSEYDVVIVSATGAYFPNVVKAKRKEQSAKSKNSAKPNALSALPRHICYCHTPPRYLYGYATAREWRKNKVLNIVGIILNHFLRIVDYHSSENVDLYIANSEEVKERIKKFYRKDAVVIYPPVISAKRNALSAKRKGEYYLTGGRLARAKHNEIPLKACLELGLPLKVFGKGFAGYEEELRSMANGGWRMANGKQPLIEFVGEITDEEKGELMRGAKAFLYASEDEDFGIIPVEAMASGTPVIAYRSGGVKETVIDGKTGVFYDELSVESMKKAIGRFERMKLDEKDCLKQAEKFSEESFQKQIKKVVEK